jgi:hypothetical protein
MIQAIDTAYVSNPDNQTGRIEATCAGESLSLNYDRELSAEKNHQRAAATLKKQMKLKGKLHGAALSSGEHVWLLIPKWMADFARFCEANDLETAGTMSTTKSLYDAQRRRVA